MPLVSLKGRASLDLGLSLSYNSLVWTKAREGTSIKFDADRGYPGPGFRLGFPVVQAGRYVNSQTGKQSYLMLLPSGRRVELRQTGSANVYEAADSSYLQLTENSDGSLTMRSMDGTSLSYVRRGSDYQCTRIKDRHGNFITAEYDEQGRITKVTDTLARVVTFNYEGERLRSITQPWNGQTHTWARFDYASILVQPNFPNLTIYGPNNTSINALSRVTIGDGSCYSFLYDGNNWGMVSAIVRRDAQERELSRTSYNIPPSSSPQSDCPRFTESRERALDWNNNAEAVTKYSIALSNGAGSMTLPTITYTNADGATSSTTTVMHKEFFGTFWEAGLTTRTETYSNGVLMRWSTTKWEQDDMIVPYWTNPRRKEISVYDERGNQRRTAIKYTGNTFRLPSDVYEYAPNGSLLRRSHTEYNLVEPYIGLRIIGLAREETLYEVSNGQERLASKFTYEYDTGTSCLSSEGAATQHDAGVAATRGNLCRTVRWDAKAPADPGHAVLLSEAGYNTTGSLIFRRDALGHTFKLGYTDSNGGSTFAYPTKVTDPDGFQSTATYNYDMGVLLTAANPKGALQTVSYDQLTGRAIRNQSNIGSYTRWEYPSLTEVKTYTKINSDKAEVSTTESYDGAGRLLRRLSQQPSSETGYSGQRFVYDALGRLWKQSNPTSVGADGNPVGTGAGWVLRERRYDWKDRVIESINADGTSGTAEYAGCGCAGGEIVSFKGELVPVDESGSQGRHQQKLYQDVLGRVVKKESFGWNGSIYSTTVNTYNGLDQLTRVREYKGLETADGSCPAGSCQEKVFEYDGHGRLSSEKAPVQEKPVSYLYNVDDTLRMVTDARGVTGSYTYNARGLVNKIEYGVPTNPGTTKPLPGISATPSVMFEYDEVGNRQSMSDGLGQVTYEYDTWSRLRSETRVFASMATTSVTPKINSAGTGDPDNYGIWILGNNCADDATVELRRNDASSQIIASYSGAELSRFPSGTQQAITLAVFEPEARSAMNDTGVRVWVTSPGGGTWSNHVVVKRAPAPAPTPTPTPGPEPTPIPEPGPRPGPGPNPNEPLPPDEGISMDEGEPAPQETATVSRSYTIGYEYNWAGSLTAIVDPFGTRINYGHDSAGQLTGVTGTPYGGVTQYASAFSYTAWGAVKSLSYGNGRTLNLTYNAMLQPATFAVGGSASSPAPLMQAEFLYNANGSIRYARDLKDARFDRSYSYDHLGRIRAAYTGMEARAHINGGNSSQFDGPYRQTYAYDEWDNLTGRNGRHWSRTVDDYGASYVNDRNKAWFYDANGAPTRMGEVESKYDAAGNKVRNFDPTPRPRFQQGLKITQGYDGDGQRLKQVENGTATYYLVSSALAGRIIAEINQSGARKQGYVYALGGKLAILDKDGQGNEQVSWLHYNPVTGSQRRTLANGNATGSGIEPDPLGVDAGLFDPYLAELDFGGASEFIYPRYGNSLFPDLGCTIDGGIAPCNLVASLLNSGAAVRCPDNDCGPRGIYSMKERRFVGTAYFDPNARDAGVGIGGANGFVPHGLRYVGGSGQPFVGNMDLLGFFGGRPEGEERSPYVEIASLGSWLPSAPENPERNYKSCVEHYKRELRHTKPSEEKLKEYKTKLNDMIEDYKQKIADQNAGTVRGVVKIVGGAVLIILASGAPEIALPIALIVEDHIYESGKIERDLDRDMQRFIRDNKNELLYEFHDELLKNFEDYCAGQFLKEPK